MDFDPLRYLELIKKYCGYREPPAAKTRAVKKPGKRGNPRTFNDDEDDDND